jgi:adenylate cyclase
MEPAAPAPVETKIAFHRGRIVKTTGDGLLIEVASAIDPLRRAADMQPAMAESIAPVRPDRRVGVLRSGR